MTKSAAPTHEEIAREAYARYVANGSQDGRDQDDWFEAERSLLSRRTQSAASFAPQRDRRQQEQRAGQGGSSSVAERSEARQPAASLGVGSSR